MTRTSWLIAAVSAVALTSACASGGADTTTRAVPPPVEAVATPIAPPTSLPSTQQQPGVYSDDQLRAFIAASLEIDPISRSLAGATPEQQAQAATQIRAILDRYGLNGETYNAIAAQAQSDPTFEARINALRTPAAPADTMQSPMPDSTETAPTNPQ